MCTSKTNGTSEDEFINSTTKRRMKLLPKRGRLFKRSPFYDPDNKVVSVGGRLANSSYNIDKKFPFLIPKCSTITVLLIRESQARNLYGGHSWHCFIFDKHLDTRRSISYKKNYLQPQALHSPRRQASSATNERSANRTFFSSFAFTHTCLDLSAQRTAAENCRTRMLPFLYVSAQRPFIWKQWQRWLKMTVWTP